MNKKYYQTMIAVVIQLEDQDVIRTSDQPENNPSKEIYR